MHCRLTIRGGNVLIIFMKPIRQTVRLYFSSSPLCSPLYLSLSVCDVSRDDRESRAAKKRVIVRVGRGGISPTTKPVSPKVHLQEDWKYPPPSLFSLPFYPRMQKISFLTLFMEREEQFQKSFEFHLVLFFGPFLECKKAWEKLRFFFRP